MMLVTPAELKAANRAEKHAKNYTASARTKTVREREGRNWRKGLVWLEPYGSHLTRQGRRTKGRERAKEQQGRDCPGFNAQLLFDCLLESDGATPHISTPLYSLLSFEKWPPIPPLLRESSPYIFFSHMDPGASCYLVSMLRDGSMSFRAPHCPRQLKWILNIWLGHQLFCNSTQCSEGEGLKGKDLLITVLVVQWARTIGGSRGCEVTIHATAQRTTWDWKVWWVIVGNIQNDTHTYVCLDSSLTCCKKNP